MSKTIYLGWFLTGAAFVGMIDTAYLGMSSLQGFVVPCGLSGGCDEVLNSPYSRVFGLSIAWFGFSFYAFVAGCSLFSVFGFPRSLRLSLGASVPAFGFTLYLLHVQAFVLKAFCQYCLLSALLVTLILGCHLLVKPWRLA
jgi:uncharacterized membrane protein